MGKPLIIVGSVLTVLCVASSIIGIVYSTFHLRDGCPNLNNCIYNVFDCKSMNGTNHCYFQGVIGNATYCTTDCVYDSTDSQLENLCPVNGSRCNMDEYNSGHYCVLNKGGCINLFYYTVLITSIWTVSGFSGAYITISLILLMNHFKRGTYHVLN